MHVHFHAIIVRLFWYIHAIIQLTIIIQINAPGKLQSVDLTFFIPAL